MINWPMTDLDKAAYKEELNQWLPSRIIDCHVHIGLQEHSVPISDERRKGNWALEVAMSFSWEDMREYYKILFPNQQVYSLAFGFPYREVNLNLNNEYVLAGTKDTSNKAFGLLVTSHEWSQDLIEESMLKGFCGIKPYPDLSQKGLECSIFDFAPKRHLEVVDRMSGILMLHIPRKGRLADENNIREILEISDSYPNIKLIIAHIGRSFCLPTAQEGLSHFINRPGIYFDTAANLNADVFQYTLETIGADRLLFGSDLPITLMKGVREHVGDKYFNFTNGEYSWNVNRKSPDDEAKYTYYIYEEIKAISRAVERSGLGLDAMEKIMFSNTAKLLGIS